MAKNIVSYLAALAILLGVAAVAVFDPGRSMPTDVTIAPIEEKVTPGPTVLACPGPLVTGTQSLNGSRDLTFDPQYDPGKVPSVPRVTAAVTVPDGLKAAANLRAVASSKSTPFTVAGDVGVVALTKPTTATILTSEPPSRGTSLLAGAVVSTASSGDLRGLAGASCLPAGSEVYLVGGDTKVETAANLFFVNVGATAAEVSVKVWGVSGPVHTLATDAIVVPQNSQRALQLPGIVKDEQRIVVRVTASGGEVASYLQDSRLSGIVPQGVDYVVPSRAPARSTTIAGLSVNKTGTDPANPALIRLLAPGTKPAKATIRLFGPKGAIDPPGMDDIPLDAGVVSDVSLAGVAAGTYTAVITSTVPVVAGAMLTNPSDQEGAAMDRAWVPSMEADTVGLLAITPDVSTTLSLYAASDSDVTLTPIGTDGTRGTAKRVTVTKDTTMTVDAASTSKEKVAAIEFAATAPLSIAAVLRQTDAGGDMITVLTPNASDTRRDTVKVGIGSTIGLD